jgi:UDP-N-acetyl-D-mannosaminuronic acid dehydrogenase
MEETNANINCVLVIGLGRIGLPQALTLAHCGIKVYGYDRNSEAIEGLRKGNTPFYEPSMDKYLKATIDKSFFPYSSWVELHKHLCEIDAIIFTIGTSAPNEQDVLNKKQLDLSAFFRLLEQIFSDKATLKKHIKLIVHTTLPLGGTDQLKNYLETQHSLNEGKDFYLGFVPERITEGAAIKEFKYLPKIVGTYSDTAFEHIATLFDNIGAKIIRVKNPITAEFCKLTDNTFRSTLFSYANEIAMHASEFDVDVEEVIAAVNHHYERNHIPLPGFVSGYCLSKDPYIFELGFTKNKGKRNFQSVWYYGRRTNDYLVEFVVEKVLHQLKHPSTSCIAILGLSFKENVDDFRMSHSLKMIDLLIKNDIQKFKLYDPYLDKNKYTSLSNDMLLYTTTKSQILDTNFFSDVDAIILCDRHKDLCQMNKFKILNNLLKQTSKPCYLFDGWDIWEEAAKVRHIEYERIGFKIQHSW